MPQRGTMEVLPGRNGRTSPQDRVYRSMLLDFYGELLAPRQRECCDLYFNEDLSLSEIAEACGISRQGAWDNIRRGSEALEEIESKTELLHRQTETGERLQRLAETLQRLETMCGENSTLREQIDAINSQIQVAQRDGDYETAAKLTYGELPALKKDNYVWNVRDYSNKVTHELGGINVPGRLYKNYTSTWDDIDKSLLGDEDFGGRLKKSSPFKSEIVAQGIASIPDQKERITAVFKLLKEKVRWNGDYAFWGKSTSKVLKEGTGSNADMNFLLINMLQDAGIESCPVVLRKRSSGVLPLSHASSKYLTTFVVGIHDTDSTYLYLDGSVEDGYINVLPADLLVDRARVISKSGQGSWVDIRSHASGQESTTIQATLGADGLLTCKSRTLLANEAAAALRKKWRLAKDSADVIGDIQERQDIIIQNYQLNGKTDFSPRVSETMEFTRQCDATDDRIYVNPLILVPMKETPFKDETRELPVEFPYKQAETMNTMITLPEGYQVEEAPKPIILKADGLTVRIMGTVSDDNVVQMQYKMNLSKLFYSNAEYQDLKAFFDQVVEHNKNMLVIKKISK